MFLFAKPSFIEGMARVIDLGSTLQEYNVSETVEEADARAIGKDWQAIGCDIKKSIETYASGK